MNWRVRWNLKATPSQVLHLDDWLNRTLYHMSILQCCNVNKSGTECNFVSGCPTIEMNQVISVWSGDLSPRSKLSQCHSFHGESPHRHPGHCTLALPLWAHGYGWGWSYNGSSLYLLLATAYYISSTHDNWQKTEKIIMWQTKIYSNLEVYVDTGVSDGILVMLQLQNWIQKHSYLHLNKLSWFCQVMF